MVIGLSWPFGWMPRPSWKRWIASWVLAPQTPQAGLYGLDRRGAQRGRHDGRADLDHRPSCIHQLVGGNAQARDCRLVQLTRDLEALALLIALERRLAVGAPDAVDGARIGAALAQTLLNYMHSLRAHGLCEGQHGRVLKHLGRSRRHRGGEKAGPHQQESSHGLAPPNGRLRNAEGLAKVPATRGNRRSAAASPAAADLAIGDGPDPAP